MFKVRQSNKAIIPRTNIRPNIYMAYVCQGEIRDVREIRKNGENGVTH